MPTARSLVALSCAALIVPLTALLIPGPYDASTALAASSVTPLSLSMSSGGSKVVFKRKGGTKGGQPFLEFKLQVVFTTSISASPQKIPIKVQLTGADAELASLLYPVVFLGSGAGALGVLQAHGYNVSIVGAAPSQTCQALASAQVCTDLANQLAESIDAALALQLTDSTARNAFLVGVQALGFPPCQGVTTTTTSSTTSTTPCPTGLTNCSGTCVNLMTDNNNCGSCGNVCTTLPVCIGGVCTIP